MERPIRLHLGCGQGEYRKWWPGWVNLDDEVDVRNLPYKDVSNIEAIHLLEHLDRTEVPNILAHWYDILEPGGKLALEMPSMDKIAQMIVDGENNLRMTLWGIFGLDQGPGMLHKWCYTTRELRIILKKAGFRDIRFPDPHYHIIKRDLRVEAIK